MNDTAKQRKEVEKKLKALSVAARAYTRTYDDYIEAIKEGNEQAKNKTNPKTA